MDNIPTVRVVLLLKFFGSQGDGSAAAVAVSHRCGDQGTVVIVSSENTDLEHIAETALDRIDAAQSYHDLSGCPNGDLDAPAEIVVPATDLNHGANVP
jgi:hypothetical protein